jgi:hypothetical protein
MNARKSGAHQVATDMGEQNRELRSFEKFMEETRAKLDTISGQIARLERDMVTRSEYNSAHVPLVKMVNRHEDELFGYDGNGGIAKERITVKKYLKWLLIATFLAALFSPHSSFVFSALRRLFE